MPVILFCLKEENTQITPTLPWCKTLMYLFRFILFTGNTDRPGSVPHMLTAAGTWPGGK